jgi:hypothetical protein
MSWNQTVRIRTSETRIDTIQKNTKALLHASKKVGLVVNPEKTNYMSMSRCQKTGQMHNIRIATRSFEDVAKFKYLGTTLNRSKLHAQSN